MAYQPGPARDVDDDGARWGGERRGEGRRDLVGRGGARAGALLPVPGVPRGGEKRRPRDRRRRGSGELRGAEAAPGRDVEVGGGPRARPVADAAGDALGGEVEEADLVFCFSFVRSFVCLFVRSFVRSRERGVKKKGQSKGSEKRERKKKLDIEETRFLSFSLTLANPGSSSTEYATSRTAWISHRPDQPR